MGPLTNVNVQEGLFAFHTVVYNYSYLSAYWTSSLITQIYNKQFNCAQSKAVSIVLNGLTPVAIQQIWQD